GADIDPAPGRRVEARELARAVEPAEPVVHLVDPGPYARQVGPPVGRHRRGGSRRCGGVQLALAAEGFEPERVQTGHRVSTLDGGSAYRPMSAFPPLLLISDLLDPLTPRARRPKLDRSQLTDSAPRPSMTSLPPVYPLRFRTPTRHQL